MDEQRKCSDRRCGWIGLESELRRVKRTEHIYGMHCPRCDGHSFYRVKLGETEKPKTGAQLITLERERQLKVLGWSPDHDDKHTDQQLAKAADSYLATVTSPDEEGDETGKSRPTHDWPWDKKEWKPSDNPIRNLVKAGALIAAEIDRLQRKAKT